ncbi:hypothetical protein BD289DRAFT_392043 [Coniella lustricola]|uniref:Rhodopsin domain-containing protein n=1 Tax=Coniella lustricola TaxID=2025994 RepID=A0A2T3A4E6_9PEZI|nr:hypothetical protein BD289DRAFT_392043 [Coniella lustricola]
MSSTTGPPAQSTAEALKSIMGVIIAVPTLVVLLRCYTRLRVSKVFGLDDVIAIIATVVLIAYACVLLAAADRGLGRHMEYIEEYGDLSDVSLFSQIAQSLAIIACTLGKTSFAITLMRIFVQAWALRILWFIIITMNLANFLCAIFVFVQCRDPRALWNFDIISTCWPTYVFTNYSLFVGSYSAAQDFILALLPCIIVIKLNMKMPEKLGIALSLSLGIFAGAAAVVKATYLVTLSDQSDRFYALPPLFMWAAAEDALAIVASSLPLLRALFPTQLTHSFDNYQLQAFEGSKDALDSSTDDRIQEQ